MNKDIDNFLYPGCRCEVWNGNVISPVKELWYFSGYGIYNEPLFRSENSRSCSLLKTFEHYHPIGTPWDFAPKDATHIEIDNNGDCIYIDENFNRYFRFRKIEWHTCPDHLKSKTWPRPEWAKEKT